MIKTTAIPDHTHPMIEVDAYKTVAPIKRVCVACRGENKRMRNVCVFLGCNKCVCIDCAPMWEPINHFEHAED